MIILYQGPLWQAWLKHEFLSQWWHGEWSHPNLYSKPGLRSLHLWLHPLHWQVSHAVPEGSECSRVWIGV